MPRSRPLRVAGLFAGIGGLETGFAAAGMETVLLSEVWESAREVLQHHLTGAALNTDVRALAALPAAANVVTAGFPCTDLSQAGRTAGIHGAQSGLVGEVFRLLETKRTPPDWLVFENVRNMLALDKGRAMAYLVERLEDLGYRWAYRLVDSRFSGVPQRRQRVLMVASRKHDPCTVLFADEAGEPEESTFRDDAFGFYWTEGLRGLGWARDAVPTLKGGSTVGIPSPPAIWVPSADPGRRIVVPSIEDAEQLQGFPRGWTAPASGKKSNGPRWKLVGNAVTVGVAAWLGERLTRPGGLVPQFYDSTQLDAGASWPTAAWGEGGKAHRVPVSLWPLRKEYSHLLDLLDASEMKPLSLRATMGFYSRAQRASLRFNEDFMLDVKQHIETAV